MKTVLFLAVLALTASAADPIDAFPPAEEGTVRHVIELPEIDDPESAKVELIVGKVARTDGANRHFLGGKIEARTLEGWGYTFYVVEKLGPMASTLMAPLPGQEPADQFVRLGGEPYLIRYNPKLPVVVYLPKGAELRYRIWQAGEEKKAPAGP